MTITERGSLESAENRDIVCRVKAKSSGSTVSTTIRWVIADGTKVKKGEPVMELDDSALKSDLTAQNIVVLNAQTAADAAEAAYQVQESQNKSDIATAELNLAVAELNRDAYKEGELLATKQGLMGTLNIAESDLTMWKERAAWSERMSKPGRRYVTTAQAQADAAKLRSAQIAKDKAVEDLRVLEKYTGPSKLKDLQGKVDEAERAIERVGIQARANLKQKKSAWESAVKVLEQEKKKARDIENEIKKCKLSSPQDGLVVYHVDERSRWGGGQQSLIAQGEPVREGQKLMRIPNLDKMLVVTKVHEAMVSRVRKGLPAQVRVEAVRGQVLRGKVKSIANVASKQSWLSSDVQVYEAHVEIEGSVPGLKPDMTAEVTIFTDNSREKALTIPVQSILGSADMGDTRRVYVNGANGPEGRDVKIGMSNDRMAEVLEGIKEGEDVIVNPTAIMTAEEKAKFAPQPTGKGGKGGKGKGGKGPGGPKG